MKARAPTREAPTREAPTREAVLAVDGLRKRFGGIAAVDGCTFRADAGAITGLIGPNGAGKSTLFDLVSGVQRPDGGRVRLAGVDATGRTPEAVARLGLVRTFQTPRLFFAMSAWENLMAAGDRQPGARLRGALLRPAAAREREAELAERAHDTLAFLQLEHLTDTPASSLSGGQRKLLALGRALMRDPRVILLDEPAAGVNETLTRTLVARIREVNARGVAFVIVEHDIDLVMSLCERVVVMHQGRVLADGEPAAVRRDPAVLEAYLGGAV